MGHAVVDRDRGRVGNNPVRVRAGIPDPVGAVNRDRARAAVALLNSHGALLRRIARRHSICREDADDALQRASVILLTKAPTLEPGRLIAWMGVVTKHEAMAVRRGRERLLGCLAPAGEQLGDPLESVVCDGPDPAERAERVEHLAEAQRALAALKANERLALVLQAQGYSYAEISELCGWTYTKVNRCLAEGRAKLRKLDPPPPTGAGGSITRARLERTS